MCSTVGCLSSPLLLLDNGLCVRCNKKGLSAGRGSSLVREAIGANPSTEKQDEPTPEKPRPKKYDRTRFDENGQYVSKQEREMRRRERLEEARRVLAEAEGTPSPGSPPGPMRSGLQSPQSPQLLNQHGQYQQYGGPPKQYDGHQQPYGYPAAAAHYSPQPELYIQSQQAPPQYPSGMASDGGGHCGTPGCSAPKMLIQGNGNCAACNKRIKKLQRKISGMNINIRHTGGGIGYAATADDVSARSRYHNQAGNPLGISLDDTSLTRTTMHYGNSESEDGTTIDQSIDNPKTVEMIKPKKKAKASGGKGPNNALTGSINEMLGTIRKAIIEHSKVSKAGNNKAKLKKLKVFFCKYSRAGDLGTFWDETEFKAMLASISCTPENKFDTARIFKKLDKTGGKTITSEEFVQFIDHVLYSETIGKKRK